MNEMLKILVGHEVKENLSLDDLKPTIAAYVDGEQPDCEKRRAKIKQLLEGWEVAIAENNTIVLQRDGQVMGIARLTHKGQRGESPVFEIENLYIDPSARGDGLSKNMRQSLLEHLNSIHLDAYIVSCTRQPRVQSVYDKLVTNGIAEDIGHGTYLRTYTDEEISDEDIAKEVSQGWKAYMFKLSDYLGDSN